MPDPRNSPWTELLRIQGAMRSRTRRVLWILSFLVPVLTWCAVSYVPWIWHPQVEVADAGDVTWFTPGMRIDRAGFEKANRIVEASHGKLATGTVANPVFLPAPHQVLVALYTSFVTPPRLKEERWLHQELWRSIQVILWGFLLSSLVGLPLGLLCGGMPSMAKLSEPFVEFFRYLPAPAFGALCVAVLGINDAPKVAIIFIGTFFQQVLVIANTVRRVEPSLVEAAQTLGASRRAQLLRVVLPASIADIYQDLRVLLGWAWTYLIVAELIGTSSGITYFINLQAKYRQYDKVMAAILIIGIVGLGSDLILAWIGRRLFPWRKDAAPLFRRRRVLASAEVAQ
ncbi:MAG: ABC transporter permease subunit [Fibrobacteres bacterium]|jgi:NitT/TauT family transport system permease protein|nr:ABC transporter permease subunit [Fibrobacterota bacterium]